MTISDEARIALSDGADRFRARRSVRCYFPSATFFVLAFTVRAVPLRS
jgi:hypothetical protein